MSKSRLEWKVGLFVLIGLVLVAILMLQFSKGLSFFQRTYQIDVRAESLGAGLKQNAAVLMAGVQVGSVADFHLDPGGRTVTIVLRIYEQYTIHKDARFVLEQAGFLGDQYVAIVPTTNAAPAFSKTKPEVAVAETPFNLQEFTRSASGFITRIDETVKKVNDLLVDMSRVVLTPGTMTNLSVAVANRRDFSDRAVTAVDNLNALVASNGPAVSYSGSNLVAFSDQLTRFANGLNGVLTTTSTEISRAVKNIESSSEVLKSLLSDVQAGKGLAGDLLKNEHMADSFSQIAHNLSITSSNLNRLGLWGILWQHKPPRTNPVPTGRALQSPKEAHE